jgi:hypothetical protein
MKTKIIKFKKRVCANCKHFDDLYYKDGRPAFIGKCKKHINKLATTGRYKTNICDDFEEREDEQSRTA